MRDFTKIMRLIIPFTEFQKVYTHLQDRGNKEVEGVALWCGSLEEDIFYVRGTIIPEQTAYKSEEGLLYMVDGEELHHINVFLYQNDLSLLAQIHSHPGAAYHSETDDDYPIVAKLGCLSIVIPDFGFGHQGIDRWAVYRLEKAKGWVELTTKQVKNLIEIT